jgi:molecular chaperone DnaK
MRSTIDYGIDLGTTNSAIALQEGVTPTLLPDAKGRTLVPSVVHIDEAGKIKVGRRAQALLSEHPADTALEFKRLMGTDTTVEFKRAGKALTPEQLSAYVLRSLAKRAKARDGQPLRAAVVTVPAMFQLPQLEATRRAAELAGITHAPLLQEPIAAAIAHFGSGQLSDGHYLVYDLGGGTFDVSLVHARAGRLRVVDHDGDNHLGGKDLDRVLSRVAVERIRESGDLGSFRRRSHAGAFKRLKAEAERVRILLSSKDEVEFLVDGLDKGASVAFPVSRAYLRELIEPVLERTTTLCKKVIERNRVRPGQLKDLVMVGGPTQTPCLPEILSQALGIPAQHHHDPTTLVAIGAAIFASTQKLPRELRGAGGEGVLELELDYEPMTTDPMPLVVGRVLDHDAPTELRVRVKASPGSYDSGELKPNAKGSFAAPLSLVKDTVNAFEVSATQGGAPIAVSPNRFSIVHGMSVAKPPLSQSVGVMLADNSVRWYLRKGAQLPATKQLVHTTTVVMSKGGSGDAINVPVVQGESEKADRNKVIGVLHIRAENIRRDLPSGTQVEVTLSVDEFSRTVATAYIPLLDQKFDEVVLFKMEVKESSTVRESLEHQRGRLEELERLAEDLEQQEGGMVSAEVAEIEALLSEDDDPDDVELADQLVRVMTQRIDQVEAKGRRQRIEEEFRRKSNSAHELAREFGTKAERKELEALETEFDAALARGNLDAAEARLEDLNSLGFRMVTRVPGFWFEMFNDVASSIPNPSPQAQVLIQRGQGLLAAGNEQPLIAVVCELFNHLPQDAQGRFQGVVSNVL